MSILEKYEWVDLWYDEANNREGTRVLVVGDSITRGSRPYIQKHVGENVHVDMLATSKALDNERYMTELMYMINSEKYSFMRFNNGLHGFHLGTDAYEREYDSLISEIITAYPEMRIEIGLSTPASVCGAPEKFSEQNDIIIERNKAAVRVAEKYGIAVDDLYSVVAERPELKVQDGIHFTDTGYELIGKHISEHIMDYVCNEKGK